MPGTTTKHINPATHQTQQYGSSNHMASTEITLRKTTNKPSNTQHTTTRLHLLRDSNATKRRNAKTQTRTRNTQNQMTSLTYAPKNRNQTNKMAHSNTKAKRISTVRRTNLTNLPITIPTLKRTTQEKARTLDITKRRRKVQTHRVTRPTETRHTQNKKTTIHIAPKSLKGQSTIIENRNKRSSQPISQRKTGTRTDTPPTNITAIIPKSINRTAAKAKNHLITKVIRPKKKRTTCRTKPKSSIKHINNRKRRQNKTKIILLPKIRTATKVKTYQDSRGYDTTQVALTKAITYK